MQTGVVFSSFWFPKINDGMWLHRVTWMSQTMAIGIYTCINCIAMYRRLRNRFQRFVILFGKHLPVHRGSNDAIIQATESNWWA
jgi:hypothetical protein